MNLEIESKKLKKIKLEENYKKEKILHQHNINPNIPSTPPTSKTTQTKKKNLLDTLMKRTNTTIYHSYKKKLLIVDKPISNQTSTIIPLNDSSTLSTTPTTSNSIIKATAEEKACQTDFDMEYHTIYSTHQKWNDKSELNNNEITENILKSSPQIHIHNHNPTNYHEDLHKDKNINNNLIIEKENSNHLNPSEYLFSSLSSNMDVEENFNDNNDNRSNSITSSNSIFTPSSTTLFMTEINNESGIRDNNENVNNADESSLSSSMPVDYYMEYIKILKTISKFSQPDGFYKNYENTLQ